MIDAYKTLGISRGATEPEIKKAFRNLARKYHPDTCSEPGAEERFKKINEAQRILSDPQEKMKHDIANGYAQAPPGTRHRSSGFGWSGGFEDFFSEMFGGGHHHHHRRPAHTHMIAVDVNMTLEEIYSGVVKTLRINNNNLEVEIPAGCSDGERFLIEVEGVSVRIQIREIPHPTITRKGLDLYKEIRVPVDVAIFGGEAKFEFFGAIKTVNVPPKTSSHKSVRIKGAGIQDPSGSGDLYLNVRIDITNEACFRLGLEGTF